MTYRLVIFDFDGTLVDSFGVFLDVGDALAARYGFERIDRGDLDGLRRLGVTELIARHRVPRWKVPLLARRARALMAQQLDRLRLFDGVSDALARLSASGVDLAIVTSNSQANVRHVLGAATVARFGQLECGVSLLGKARRLRRVLARTGVPAAQALFVGDELRDAHAARAVGVPFGAVAWGYTHVDALRAHDPARVFLRVEELAAWVDEPAGTG